MKMKILSILICITVTIGCVFTVAASMGIEKQISITQSGGSQLRGNTLITEAGNSRVIEVDSGGTIVWEKAGLNFPNDVERLANGNTLITEFLGDRVIEVDSDGTIVWEKAELNMPNDAERVADGNTLITEAGNSRVIEVDSGGTIVWEKAGLNGPHDAERLANGNTLITEYFARVIEVDSGGSIVWEKAGLSHPVDAERLANGNTLITEFPGDRVIEVDSSGSIVWEKAELNFPNDAERVADGNTLITEAGNSRVIEVDSGGTIVWEKAGLNGPDDAERISNSPSAPTIKGETSGKTGRSYEYAFNAVDPDGEDVRYFIDWGDNTSEWTGFNASGTDIMVKHKWSNKGTYNITAKAQDIHGFEGPEGQLTVTMPKKKAFNFKFNLLGWLFERFPNLFPILKYIL